MTYCFAPPQAFSIIGQWLYDWQTILSGLLASVAAVVTVWKLHGQIAQVERHRRDDIDRRHNAARAVLPLALAAISEFCRAMVEQVASELERNRDKFDVGFDENANDTKIKFSPVDLPNNVIVTFERFVETLTNTDSVRHVAELISRIQITQSRFNDFKIGQPGFTIGLYELIIGVATISVLNEKLYNYGRYVSDDSFAMVDKVPNSESWQLIHGKAQSMVFWRRSPDFFFAGIQERINALEANDNSPWIKALNK